MNYRVVITDDAEAEFDREIDYSIARWGKRHALNYARELRRVAHSIGNEPFSGQMKADWGDSVRGKRYKGNWIAYRVNEAERIVQIIGFPSVYQNIHYDN